jgi:hypothetical protein
MQALANCVGLGHTLQSQVSHLASHWLPHQASRQLSSDIIGSDGTDINFKRKSNFVRVNIMPKQQNQ